MAEVVCYIYIFHLT